MKINILLLLLVSVASSLECIEEDDNQYFSASLGSSVVFLGEDLYFRSDDVTEICGDGGYVTCISTYTKENKFGHYQLGSLRFSCSNGYVSETHGDSTAGAEECADGGITTAYGVVGNTILNNGGFGGYDSSGTQTTLSRWGGTGQESEATEISCPRDRYLIGFSVFYPDATYYTDLDNLWGFRMICSDEELCPQDGLTISNDVETNGSVGDFDTNGSVNGAVDSEDAQDSGFANSGYSLSIANLSFVIVAVSLFLV